MKMAGKKGGFVVISLGGSLIAPDGIDIGFLRRFRHAVLQMVRKGSQVIIVCGGGATNRAYNVAAKKLAKPTDRDLDLIGIAATMLNAELVRSLFGRLAHNAVVSDPSKKVITTKKIIVACGWKPGWSSDYDAVLLATNHRAGKIVNLTNIDYVYDKDPKKHKNARKVERLRWDEYLSIVGKAWKPRMSTPFDPVASQLARKKGISVLIVNGKKPSNLKVLAGKKVPCTIIG